MGTKKIVIGKDIIMDLIYGKLRGPVISDAPKGLEIQDVYIDVKHSKHTKDVAINVWHANFPRVKFGEEIPIFPVTFSKRMDLATRALINDLKATVDIDMPMETNALIGNVCNALESANAECTNIRDECFDLRQKITMLENKLANIKGFLDEDQ